jgi:peptide/nickel transport system ATP-binding protein
MTALTATGLRARHPGGPWVIDGLDLTVERGEQVGLVGRSGAGKSTLARLLMGLAPRAAGRLTVLGCPVPLRARSRAAWAATQLLTQDPDAHLDPWRTAGQMVARSARLHGHPSPDAAGQAALAQVGLAHALDRHPLRLSGGERRRLGVARVHLAGPELLVADEPTAGVDAAQRDGILALLLRPPGRPPPSAVVISHDLGLLSRWCDRLLVLAEGRVVDHIAPADLPAEPRPDRHAETRALLAAARESGAVPPAGAP